jgi:transglutaminase-like putative cysteine protease
MKKYFSCLILFSLTSFYTSAQAGIYSLLSVPDSIKKNASIITHYEKIDFEVEDLDHTTQKVHKIFTVLNEEGKDALLFQEYTSKYILLEDAEIRVFDAAGKQTAKYKKKDMSTSAIGEGLIDDGYVTYYYIPSGTYPVTVELKYEKKIKSTLSIPDYRFIGAGEAVIESHYTAKIPADFNLRHKARNTSIEPVITDAGKYKRYEWSVKNLAAVKYEAGAVSAGNKYPYIAIVLDQFSHYGNRGELTTWENFGKWISNLYNGLDVLPENRQLYFKELVKDAADDKEKVRRIYTHMQQNFRYVSIQLGIGGLKPFSAEFTDQKKYGDCKALSNYMKAALSAVGIKSHVAIINSDYNSLPVDPSFPANDFNHVILCVPRTKDSIWLECTSSTADFGVLGTFTENRNALLVTDNGGVLVPTPKSMPGSNVFSAHTTVQLMDDLSGKTESIFTTKGEYKEMMNSILKEKKDDQKESIVLYLGFKQPDDFILSQDKNTGDHISKLEMVVAKIPEFNSGNKLFINPRIYKMWSNKMPKAEDRTLDFYFRYPFEKYDTTILKFPEGFKPDVLPKEKKLSCAYANYSSAYRYDEKVNAVYSTSSLILKQHKIPAAEYAGVKKFFDEMMQDDAEKIVIKKPDTKPAEKKAF